MTPSQRERLRFAYQQARFMRPDAARFVRPDAARYLRPQLVEHKYRPDQPGRLEIRTAANGPKTAAFRPTSARNAKAAQAASRH
jgi:hypothetical protein